MITLLGVLGLSVIATPSQGLVYADESLEPTDAISPDFPYWASVTQRRYEGPTVIYLGTGWALTARHVGRGEIVLADQIIRPERRLGHTLLNRDGSPADAMVFALNREDLPKDMPIVAIASRPPDIGEEVILIGFGRIQRGRVQWGEPGHPHTAFIWNHHGEKRWGTNRVGSTDAWLRQDRYLTHAITMAFDSFGSQASTLHEAAATVGDSGGAVFVKRDGKWLLAGLITSISGPVGRPSRSSAIGDVTYAADLSRYREEILRWTRQECANELDDDGDGKIDFPDDPDCERPTDFNERSNSRASDLLGPPRWGIALILLGVTLGALFWRRRQRGINTPASMSSPNTS